LYTEIGGGVEPPLGLGGKIKITEARCPDRSTPPFRTAEKPLG
jgi:hypothetical protein